MQNHTGFRWRFQFFATRIGEIVGSSAAFIAAALIVIAWAVSGPLFDYSDTWQLWINTGTTVVTFLMVFLIQYTQNRDTRALHLKLDELLRAMDGARTEMVDLKDLSDEELTRLEKSFSRLAKFASRHGVAARTVEEAETAGTVGEGEAAEVAKAADAAAQLLSRNPAQARNIAGAETSMAGAASTRKSTG